MLDRFLKVRATDSDILTYDLVSAVEGVSRSEWVRETLGREAEKVKSRIDRAAQGRARDADGGPIHHSEEEGAHHAN